jgi:chromosome segregation ATPase
VASSGAAQAAGQGAGELRDLRERLLALTNAETELRRELKAARAQIAQLAQNEAMARSLLKESHSVTRALHERTRLETAAATAQLRESLEAERAERAKSQAELARATDELRARGNRPDAEIESLRALFADLMRGEAQGRQRLERLQQQVAEHERQRQELQQQLDLEAEARRKAEAQLLSTAPLVPAGEELREQLRELETAAAELEKRNAALGRELAEERGKARAQAERAVTELERARDQAKAAAASEQEARDALEEAKAVAAGLRAEMGRLESALAVRTEAESAARAATAQAEDQLADLRKKSEQERARANAEIARRAQDVETLQGAAAAASAAAKKAAADLEEEKTAAAGLRDEVGRLESALAARTEAESAARAATAEAERERDEAQRTLAGLEAALEWLRASSAQQALKARDELAESGQLRQALQQQLADVGVRLEQSETGRAALEERVVRLQAELHLAAGEARAQQDDLERSVEEERAKLAAAKAEHARLAAEADRLRASEEERGRRAEALAGELELARGEAETLQGALDRSGVALASLQARHSKLESDLTKALHERDEEARSRDEQAALLREERTQAAGHIAEQKRLADELSAETKRAEAALHESQELAARCNTSERELAEAALRMRAAETEAAQAKVALERLGAIAGARREALIAELDGRFGDAEALLQAELGQSPIEAPLFLQLGKLHYAWAEGAPGSHEEIAERLLARASELDLHDATAPLYLGHARLRRGRYGAAGEAYLETIRRDAKCAPAHEALAVLSARSMKRQTRIAFAAAISLLLSSAALFIHQFVQGRPAPAASALSESQDRREGNEAVPARGRAGR